MSDIGGVELPPMPPTATTKPITIRNFPADLWADFRSHVVRQDSTVSKVTAQAIREFLARQSERPCDTQS